ncbi:MAG: (d)CMP kinase [Solirubrobacterales bacterium]|nr:(d)CMP kinase [Solirubrobacterales bacterium]HMT05071.1 (d)CMP kinase [Solirubrobacterales bacterium]
MVIAIDGPAGAGKSTVARGLARELGFTYLDSGAMYRCVAFTCLDWGADPTSSGEATSTAESIEIGFEDGEVLIDGVPVTGEIRTPEVTEAASLVSVHPGVRAAMVAEQQRLIATGPYVTEGRDIGTVVAPDSPLKIFLTASPEARAERRAAETGADVAAVKSAQDERDRRDSEREHGALYAAGDAVTIDSTGLTAEEVVSRIAGLARERGLA